MNINIEQLKKKITYRSYYRGTKEMDKLLRAFTKSCINELSYEELLDLESLLNIDDNNLYSFFNGTDTNVQFKDSKINLLFKNFKYNDKK